MKQKAALYIRISTSEQSEFSPEAQKRALLQYAKTQNYAVNPAQIYIDEGISGRKAEKRPAFMQMIAAAKKRSFQAILVHKFDRFARSREDSVVYKSLLKKECGVKVISITESVEDDKFAVILEAMLEAMAEYYSINLAEEVKKGMTEKAAQGGLQTKAAFGYQVQENQLQPDEAEAEFVREIFTRFLAGDGYFTIAKWLNSMGVTTKRGNPFEGRAIAYIIQNPVYIGKLRWNPSGKTGRDYKNPHLILSNAAHEPLITEMQWHTAQIRAAAQSQTQKTHKKPSATQKTWLSGLLRCANCGHTLVRNGKQYWKCNGYLKGKCSKSQHVSDTRIKQALYTQLEADLHTNVTISAKIQKKENDISRQIKNLQKQKEKCKKKEERLHKLYLEGIESFEDYKANKAELQAELRQITAEIKHKNTEKRQKTTPKMPETTPNFQHCKVEFHLNNEQIAQEKKQNALTSIIEQCIWDKTKNELEIYYHSMSPAP